MSRPHMYDDTPLLRYVAELRVNSGPYRPTPTQAGAIRQAVGLVPGSAQWPRYRIAQAEDRLKKAYEEDREVLEHEAKAHAHYPWPLPPTLVEWPLDPEQRQRQHDKLRLEDGLREVASWAAALAALVAERPASGFNNPDLIAHASALVGIVRKEKAKRQAEMCLGDRGKNYPE